MGRKRAAVTPGEAPAAAPVEAGPAGIMTKADAVRAALADGVDRPTEAVAHVKQKYGLDITPQQFSTYKSLAKKKGGQEGHGKRGRRPGVRAATRPATPAPANGPDFFPALEAIKTLVDQLGVDRVQKIAELFRR